MVGDVFGCGGEVFAAYVFVAGFAGAAIYVTAFVTEEFDFVFFFLGECGKFVETFIQAEVWDYVFEIRSVQFGTQVFKICEDFCG